MSVEVNQITKIYGTQRALDEVSFSIKSGEIVGLLGPNGAGKSTMMKIITCFIPQNSGNVSVCGFDVVEQSLEVRKRVGYLPENNPQYYDLYVREYLEFVAGIYKLGKRAKSRIEEMIEITGLEIEQHKKIGALSKGYRQRVGLAQAMIHEPEVLILDEPTSGLDPNQIIDIRNLIKKIGKQKTVIFSTHIMQEVEAICSKVVIIDKGKIIANAPTAELSKMSTNKQTIIVEFNQEVQKNQLLSIGGVKEARPIEKNTWQLIAEGALDIRSNVFQFAVNHNYTVLSMKNEEISIEKIFQQLTKN